VPSKSEAGEGFLYVETNPSSGADFVHANFSRKGRRKHSLVFFKLRRN
jgi:hypothetical protein